MIPIRWRLSKRLATAAKPRELEQQFEARASELRAAFVAEVATLYQGEGA
jgi:hypothetical protein